MYFNQPSSFKTLSPNAAKVLKMSAKETSLRKLQVRKLLISSELSYVSQNGCHSVLPLLHRRLVQGLHPRL